MLLEFASSLYRHAAGSASESPWHASSRYLPLNGCPCAEGTHVDLFALGLPLGNLEQVQRAVRTVLEST